MRNRYRLAHFSKKIENSSANILASEYPIKKNTKLFKVYFSLKDISSGTGSLNKARLKYEIYLMLNTGPIAV